MFEEARYELRYVNIVLSLIVNSREYRDVYWCLRKHLTDMSWDMLILYFLWLSIPESTWLSIPESTEMSTGVWGSTSLIWVEICWYCIFFDCQFQRVQRCLLVFEEAPHWYDLRYVIIVLSLIVDSWEYRDVYWCLRKYLTDMTWDMLILYYLWLLIAESTKMSTGVWGIKGSWLPQWYDLRYVNIVLSMIVNSREYKDVYWCLRNQRQLVTSMIWLEIC